MARIYPVKPYYYAKDNPMNFFEALGFSFLLSLCVALICLLTCMMLLYTPSDPMVWKIIFGIPSITWVLATLGISSWHHPVSLIRYIKYKKKVKQYNLKMAGFSLEDDRIDSLHFAKILNKKVM